MKLSVLTNLSMKISILVSICAKYEDDKIDNQNLVCAYKMQQACTCHALQTGIYSIPCGYLSLSGMVHTAATNP